MQPLRIEALAKVLAKGFSDPVPYDDMPEERKNMWRNLAHNYAAVLLGGEPVVTVEHGVREAKSKRVYGPYSVKQYTSHTNVVRKKYVYAAGAFVTPWEEV